MMIGLIIGAVVVGVVLVFFLAKFEKNTIIKDIEDVHYIGDVDGVPSWMWLVEHLAHEQFDTREEVDEFLEFFKYDIETYKSDDSFKTAFYGLLNVKIKELK